MAKDKGAEPMAPEVETQLVSAQVPAVFNSVMTASSEAVGYSQRLDKTVFIELQQALGIGRVVVEVQSESDMQPVTEAVEDRNGQ